MDSLLLGGSENEEPSLPDSVLKSLLLDVSLFSREISYVFVHAFISLRMILHRQLTTVNHFISSLFLRQVTIYT